MAEAGCPTPDVIA